MRGVTGSPRHSLIAIGERGDGGLLARVPLPHGANVFPRVSCFAHIDQSLVSGIAMVVSTTDGTSREL